MKHTKTSRTRRRAVAALELAVFLPVLTLLTLGVLDFARLFSSYTTITSCARNGALYASDATAAARSPYASYKQAAMADGSSLNPALADTNVSLAGGSDGYGSFVAVTVTYDVPTLTGLLGTSKTTLVRTVRMRVAPAFPD